MYSGSAQGVVERVINVRYYHYDYYYDKLYYQSLHAAKTILHNNLSLAVSVTDTFFGHANRRNTRRTRTYSAAKV